MWMDDPASRNTVARISSILPLAVQAVPNAANYMPSVLFFKVVSVPPMRRRKKYENETYIGCPVIGLI